MLAETHATAPSPPQNHWKLLNRPTIHILLIVVIGIICYSNTFHVPMLLDDESSIQLHTPVHGLANYFKDWLGYNFLPNRAFGYLTFALNYEFGGLNVTGYHVVNLGVHLAASVLVYLLVLQTFRTPFMSRAGISPDSVGVFACVVALFFVCHPIQTQAVTYIVQRLTSMAAMFYLAAFVCYLKWRLSLSDAANSSRHMIGWYLLTLACIVLAMRTKEISFTLPIMLLIYEYSFFGPLSRKLIVKLTPLLLTLAIIPVTMYVHVSSTAQSATGDVSYLSDVNTPAYNIVRITRPEYLYTQFSVIVTYLRLLFMPVNQHLDYDYPISRTIFASRPLLSLLLLLSILLLAVFMFLKSRQPIGCTAWKNPEDSCAHSPLLRLAAFGIFWFFITLSVESSIIVLLDVVYEHRLYLPSFGFFLALAALVALGLQRLEQRYPYARKALFTMVGVIIATLSVATYTRNHVWRDWISLWSDNVAKTPEKPRPHNILGIGYYYRGDFDNAMREYREAVRLKPDFIEAYYNMALVHTAKKERREAIAMYTKVLGLSAFNSAQHAKASNEIGVNYAELGEIDRAIAAFESAVKYEPESAEFRNNYAFALSRAGRVDSAVQQYREALRLDPENSYAREALLEIYKSPDLSGAKGKPSAGKSSE